MHHHIDKVSNGCSDEHSEKSDTISGEMKEVMQKNPSEKTVPQQVNDVGVQGERCNQSVKFEIVQNGGGISGTLLKPDRFQMPVAGEAVYKNQASYDHRTHGTEGRNEGVCLNRRRPVTIFAVISCYLVQSSFLLPGIDINLNMIR